jgi:FtsZ-interacting cell division protein ZipA
VGAQQLGPGLHARLGKPLRWFGRVRSEAPWQLVTDDSQQRYAELCACLLLADRNGPVSQGQMGAFLRAAGEVASAIDARAHVPDAAAELQRAEALDKLCAELDVQIGLTLLKPEPGTVPGTKLRGVAEAAGFHLAPAGRFEHVQEDTGAVLYTLQNVRNDPFTAESLRISAVNGVVFLLDVPRVADPARTFDQMKLCAKRMARSLGAELVDDNRRPLDDAALSKIRGQVQAAAEALEQVHIEPGSPRAAALFGA